MKEADVKRVKNLFISLGGQIVFKKTCPDELIKLFEAAGGKIVDEPMETNGWQVDYWIRGTYKKKKYFLSGSAYYGNGRIEEVDEEEWNLHTQ